MFFFVLTYIWQATWHVKHLHSVKYILRLLAMESQLVKLEAMLPSLVICGRSYTCFWNVLFEKVGIWLLIPLLQSTSPALHIVLHMIFICTSELKKHKSIHGNPSFVDFCCCWHYVDDLTTFWITVYLLFV